MLFGRKVFANARCANIGYGMGKNFLIGRSLIKFIMEISKEDIKAISRDIRDLKEKVEDMSIILEELLEIYTDVFCDLQDDYLEKLEEIKKERGRIFNSIEEFDEYFELNESI